MSTNIYICNLQIKGSERKQEYLYSSSPNDGVGIGNGTWQQHEQNFNPTAVRKAKIIYNFGLSESDRVKVFTLKVFYVMGKALTGNLSYTRTGLVL